MKLNNFQINKIKGLLDLKGKTSIIVDPYNNFESCESIILIDDEGMISLYEHTILDNYDRILLNVESYFENYDLNKFIKHLYYNHLNKNGILIGLFENVNITNFKKLFGDVFVEVNNELNNIQLMIVRS